MMRLCRSTDATHERRRWRGVGAGIDRLLQSAIFCTQGEPSAWLVNRRLTLFRDAMVPILNRLTRPPARRRA